MEMLCSEEDVEKNSELSNDDGVKPSSSNAWTHSPDKLSSCSEQITNGYIKDTKKDVPYGHSEVSLPTKPEPPADSDCCGSGCIPCVFDIYEQELKIWEQECNRIRNKDILSDLKEVRVQHYLNNIMKDI